MVCVIGLMGNNNDSFEWGDVYFQSSKIGRVSESRERMDGLVQWFPTTVAGTTSTPQAFVSLQCHLQVNFTSYLHS